MSTSLRMEIEQMHNSLQQQQLEIEQMHIDSLQQQQRQWEEENMERELRMALDASMVDLSASMPSRVTSKSIPSTTPRRNTFANCRDEAARLQSVRENVRRQRRERQEQKERQRLMQQAKTLREAEEEAVMEAIRLSLADC